MKINILHEGDRVMNITNDFIVVKRANQEFDIIPFYKEGQGIWIDRENMITIGYGDNVIEMEIDDIKILNF